MTTSILSLLQKLPETIKDALSLFGDIPLLEREIFISKAIGRRKEFLYSHPDYILSEGEMEAFVSMCERRRSGEPVAYITEEKEFFSINFIVKKGVFIPRPETEFLVEESINIIEQRKFSRILDLGTGCGAIGLSIAKNVRDCEVFLSDISERAIEVARENARMLHLTERVHIVRGDWLSPFKRHSFDIIISNPPYLREEEFRGNPELSFEPEIAFLAGDDGLLFIRRTLIEGVEYLRENGYILLEIGYDQAERVEMLAYSLGLKIRFVKDFGGIKRVAVVIL